MWASRTVCLQNALLQNLKRAASRSLPVATSAKQQSLKQSGVFDNTPRRKFSTEGETTASEPKPLVPGVGIAKTSTGLVGLAVEPDWYNKMLFKFQLLLDNLEASEIPETNQYRIDVTQWCNYVLETARANPDDPEAVEAAVRMGQVEELLEMADDEMVAMEAYIGGRLWEYLDEDNPTVVDMDPDPMADPAGPDADPVIARKIREGMEGLKKDA